MTVYHGSIIQELKYFKKNNQIAFIDQKALDALLVFNSSYEVEGYDAKNFILRSFTDRIWNRALLSILLHEIISHSARRWIYIIKAGFPNRYKPVNMA